MVVSVLDLPEPEVKYTVRIVFSNPVGSAMPYRVLFEKFDTFCEAELFVSLNSYGCFSCSINKIESYKIVSPYRHDTTN